MKRGVGRKGSENPKITIAGGRSGRRPLSDVVGRTRACCSCVVAADLACTSSQLIYEYDLPSSPQTNQVIQCCGPGLFVRIARVGS